MTTTATTKETKSLLETIFCLEQKFEFTSVELHQKPSEAFLSQLESLDQKRQEIDSCFQVEKRDFRKRYFELEFIKETCLESIDLGLCLSAARKRIKKDGLKDFEVNYFLPLPNAFNENEHDPSIEKYFLEMDELPWSDLARAFKKDYPSLFYNSPSLASLLNPFGEDINITRLADALAGRLLVSVLSSFRLPVGDLDRAAREISNRSASRVQLNQLYQMAIEHNYVDILETMLYAKVETGEDKMALLLNAVRSGQKDVCSFLCGSSYIKLEYRHEKEGKTALHVAVECGNLEIVLLLLDSGASINSLTFSSTSSLHLSCRKGHLSITKLLIDRGAEVNLQDSKGWAPIHEAAALGRSNSIAYLIRIEECNLDLKTNSGQTPADLALIGDHGAVWALLEKQKEKKK